MNSDAFKDRLQIAIGKESQRSFSSRCAISTGTLSSYLNGITTPDLENLKKIADVSGYRMAWLATGEGTMKRGEVVELKAEPAKEVAAANIADLSPIKAAAVSYIKAMSDAEAAEVIKFLVPQQKAMSIEEIHFRELTKNFTAEEREELRTVLDEQSKKRSGCYDNLNYQEVLRPTGT